MFSNDNYGLYAVDRLDSNEFIGFIGFWHPSFESNFTPCIEIGWRIKQKEWNNGFATEGASRCLKFGFDDLKFSEILSLTSKVNLKSERIMKKIGMHKWGEFEHPNITDGNRLKTHIVYKIKNTVYNAVFSK
jgi:ribosomal-protein-alanine N-acetyltransferase